MLTIRPERPQDYPAISTINRLAFAVNLKPGWLKICVTPLRSSPSFPSSPAG